MSVLLYMLVGVVVGVGAAGWRAVLLARRDEFRRANRWLRASGLIAAGTAVALTAIMLKWPYVEEKTTVVEEAGRQVTEVVQTLKKVWKWNIWPTTETQEEEIVITIPPKMSERTDYRFSVVLLTLLGVVGVATYFAEVKAIHVAWRWFG